MQGSAPDVELICFDIGGVLIRLSQGWEHACRRADVPLAPSMNDPSVLSRIRALVQQHESGLIDCDAFDDATAQITEHTAEQVAAMSMAWLQGRFAGVLPLIDQVLAAGVKAACLSNTNDRHWQMMVDAGPQQLPIDRLHYRFASFQINACKPDAAIYQYVEQTTDLTPAAILFFDDHPPNVKVAHQRGWLAHWIEPDGDPATQMRRHLQSYCVL